MQVAAVTQRVEQVSLVAVLLPLLVVASTCLTLLELTHHRDLHHLLLVIFLH